MNELDKYYKEKKENIEKQGKDTAMKQLGIDFIVKTAKYNYSYNFSWMGRPIIQFPQDMIAMQEIIWDLKPDLIIETGIAHGGSLIFYASLLELIGGKGEILGIDIDIRAHNRKLIEEHPMYKRISMIEGDSIGKETLEQVSKFAENKEKVLVILDSHHVHDHVLKELELYSPFVTKGSYIVVFDTVVEDMPDELFEHRPWCQGDNPKTAVIEFLKNNKDFEIDRDIENKILITVAPSGYLRKIK
ncbi:MAG: cephalosporin hydroxylase family protein [Candidatus Heimdallarchaeota archaeon]